jgi:putative membrane protein
MLIGTKSGRIFGNYVYLERLKVSIFEIPMIFVLNNVLILLGSFHIARNFLKSSWLKIVGGAFLVAFFDFVFEPFAIKLNYWAWTDYFRINYGGIPLQNFLAWFIIGLISSTFIYFYKQKLEPKILFAFWFSELFFFQITQIL